VAPFEAVPLEVDDEPDWALTRGEVMRARALESPPAPVPANGAAATTTTTATTTAPPANGAAPLCSECGQPARVGRMTCSASCASARKRRRGAERSRAARSNRQLLGAPLRRANGRRASVPPAVVTPAPGEPEAPLPHDWRRLAGVVEALAGAGLRVALNVEGVEVVVSNA
jgi:hypothetical protein